MFYFRLELLSSVSSGEVAGEGEAVEVEDYIDGVAGLGEFGNEFGAVVSGEDASVAFGIADFEGLDIGTVVAGDVHFCGLEVNAAENQGSRRSMAFTSITNSSTTSGTTFRERIFS